MTKHQKKVFFAQKQETEKFPFFCSPNKVINFGMTKKPLRPPTNFLRWVGLKLFQPQCHKNLGLEGFYLLLSVVFVWNPFNFTSWNTFYPHNTSRDKAPSHVNWILSFTPIPPMSPLSIVFQILPYPQFLLLKTRAEKEQEWQHPWLFACFCFDAFDSSGRCQWCILYCMFCQKETEGFRSLGRVLDDCTRDGNALCGAYQRKSFQCTTRISLMIWFTLPSWVYPLGETLDIS